MRKILFNIWTNHKNKEATKKAREITHSFNIIEKNGVIYIVHDRFGVEPKAISVIDDNTKASEIIELLNTCRKAALQFNNNE